MGLNVDLRQMNSFQTVIDDESKFTHAVLKKIALARCLLAKADIYILDKPFLDLTE